MARKRWQARWLALGVVWGTLGSPGAGAETRGAPWEILQDELGEAAADREPPAGAPEPGGPAFQPPAGPALSAYRRFLVSQGWEGPPVWHSAGLVPAGNRRLGVNVFLPPGSPRGVFLFVHGYQAHAGDFGALLAAVVQRGWMVVTLDLPGHGMSEGPRSDIGDFSEYGDAVADWLRWVDGHVAWPRLRVLAAHSLGTAACWEALRRPTTPVPSQVWFFAPLVRTGWYPLLCWTQDTLGGALGEVPSPFGSDGYLDGDRTPVHWFRALRAWVDRLEGQALDLPLTIWSGDQDTVVDAGWNRRTYERLVPGARYRLLAGRDHLFLTDAAQRARVLPLVVEELPSQETQEVQP